MLKNSGREYIALMGRADATCATLHKRVSVLRWDDAVVHLERYVHLHFSLLRISSSSVAVALPAGLKAHPVEAAEFQDIVLARKPHHGQKDPLTAGLKF